MITFKPNRNVGSDGKNYVKGQTYTAEVLPISSRYVEILGEYNPIPEQKVVFKKRRRRTKKTNK